MNMDTAIIKKETVSYLPKINPSLAGCPRAIRSLGINSNACKPFWEDDLESYLVLPRLNQIVPRVTPPDVPFGSYTHTRWTYHVELTR